MTRESNLWALVLAAGDGTRLRTLTTLPDGSAIPKQYCSLRGGPSLLQEALKRARAVTAGENICVVVAQKHRRWWAPQLKHVPAENIIAQPENLGTAVGVLLPLLHIFERGADARIVLLPSDHHVQNEEILIQALRGIAAKTSLDQEMPTLMGVIPEEPDAGLGYIVPGPRRLHFGHDVVQFVEKPSVVEAQTLIERGGLWNTFIIVSSIRPLIALYQRRYPELLAAMRSAVCRDLETSGRARAVTDLYTRLPALDFSRDILAGQEANLCVVGVPRCGWSDLGTPERVACALAYTPIRGRQCREDIETSPLSLAEQRERRDRGALSLGISK